ncbi:MAG: TolC family outer membrane protein [Pseudomonadota bacterium]
MRKPLIASLIASALFTLNAQAADLVQIYRDALVNDMQYASARASLAAGQEKAPQGRALLLPTIGLSGGKSHNDSSTGQEEGDNVHRTSNSSNYTLSLSQPLFRWANWQQYQQSKLQVMVSEAQFAQAQQDLMVRVAQAYFDILTAQDTLAAIQAQKVATTEQLASAKRNFEVGTQTITDTNEAQARSDLVVAQELAAINDLEIKRTALQQIIGKPPGALATLKTGVAINTPVPAAIEPWVESAEKQNYGVMSAQIALEIAKHEISKTRAGHYPTVDLVASAGRSNAGLTALSSSSTATNSNAIGIQWNIPLFAGFGVTSRVRETIALEDKARFDLESVRRSATQATRQAYLGVNSGLAQVRALEAAEVSSQSALESNQLGYQVGVRINIDVLNAQQQLALTRQSLAKARYDTVMNGIRLKSAAGTLKEEDLSLVNSLLQP